MSGTSSTPNATATRVAAVVYVMSGICQPLIMTWCKNSGLADSGAQLYMFFYYLGPTCLLFPLFVYDQNERQRPCISVVLKAALIACFDITAQSLNYTGAGYAGATIFAVVYSSVTVWTAVFSRLFLKRTLKWKQWFAVFVVFAGLAITAMDSVNLGPNVWRGTCMILFGSGMHGATYVMSEAIMRGGKDINNNENDGVVTASTSTINNGNKRERLLPGENSAIQGLVACTGLLIWQFVYTASRWETAIVEPMEAAGTTYIQAWCILILFGLANLFHSFSFYHTLAHYPGGSTSAGVMKGLQAVLVFVAAHFLYCTTNNHEMCFSFIKFVSLITVVGGVFLFSISTEADHHRDEGYSDITNDAVEIETVAEANC